MSQVIDKLAAKASTVLVLNRPEDVEGFENPVYDTRIVKDSYDLIFIFIFHLDEFKAFANHIIERNLLAIDGYAFFIYPKKGNKKYREYIGRDEFIEKSDMDEEGYYGDSMLKFARMLAFDETFTMVGLKHQIKKANKSSKPSQCVSDYIDRIPDVQKYLAGNQSLLSFFNALTPGYQRDWARYVYSAQTEETVKKRLIEMSDILSQGYKSKDLYRRGEKRQ